MSTSAVLSPARPAADDDWVFPEDESRSPDVATKYWIRFTDEHDDSSSAVLAVLALRAREDLRGDDPDLLDGYSGRGETADDVAILGVMNQDVEE